MLTIPRLFSKKDTRLDILILILASLFLGARLWRILGTRHGPKQSSKGKKSRGKVIYLKKEDVSIEKETLQDREEFYSEFRESDFLDGAEKAFLMILQAYYRGQEAVLRKLVQKDLIQKILFQKTPPTDIPKIQILSAHIQSKGSKKGAFWVTVQFISLQKKGNQEEELEDIWTFEKEISSSNPNWIVSAIDFQPNPEEQKSGSIDSPP